MDYSPTAIAAKRNVYRQNFGDEYEEEQTSRRKEKYDHELRNSPKKKVGAITSMDSNTNTYAEQEKLRYVKYKIYKVFYIAIYM